jgi:hypothetical protein
MFARMLISVVLSLLVSLTALAQDTTKPSYDQAKQDNAQAAPQENQERSASKIKTVTGCLQKGDQPDEFSITGEDGTRWDLRSSAVKLADHIGHQVTIEGSRTHETKAEEKKEGQVENAARKDELGELRVTSLKMVSQSCTK